MVAIFVAGCLAIAFEHNIRINKTASTLITGVLCCTVYVLFTSTEAERIVGELSKHLAETSQILFFLLGAMTIVELIDAHQGFKVVTNSIKTRNCRALLWIISLVAFSCRRCSTT